MSYFAAITQNVMADPLNSSTANLTAGNSYTFTGLSASSLGIAGIQVSLKTDQDCDVYVEQSPDGSNWDISDHFIYSREHDNFGVTVQAISSYLRVRVVVSDSVATTYFRLQTALCPIVEVVPRSLTDKGNMKIAIKEMEDEYGFQLESTPLRDLKVCQPYKLVGSSFIDSPDYSFWTFSSTGTSAATALSAGIVSLSAGTASGGYGMLTSVRNGRFVYANPNLYRGVIRHKNLSIANNVRRWGAMSLTGTAPLNGFYFELSGTADTLSVCYANNGVTAGVESGSFNGYSDHHYCDTDVHSYQIIYTIGSAIFFIDDVLIHTFTPTTTQLSGNFNLPISHVIVNSASGITNPGMEVWAGTILRLGREESAPHVFHISGNAATWLIKQSPGKMHKLIFNNTSGSTVTIYDSLSGGGTTIGVITTAAGALGEWDYHVPFYTGLTIVTSGNSLDATVVYE